MDILKKALKMLSAHSLCDHCLGRQFALLGHGLENSERGNAIKLVLILRAHVLAHCGKEAGFQALRVLAENGFSDVATKVLETLGKPVRIRDRSQECYLCGNRFRLTRDLTEKALGLLDDYEYNTFLVGIRLPVSCAEREDEFRAEFEVIHGESMRNEFGRVIGKEISQHVEKPVDFRKPDIVALIDPFEESVSLQVNPLFVSGRYRKLARDLPQSKWFCSACYGRGCKKCGWTGKMYQNSVQEIIEEPFLRATHGAESSFHASGREDIDARMLGNGRPFVIEISRPRKRFLDLGQLEKGVNTRGKGKVEVCALSPADRDFVRRLKKGESTQKEYRVEVEFENKMTAEDVRLLEKQLSNSMVRQQTPLRVMHRRADLTREKYIYNVTVKKLSSKKAEMKIKCQGGLYVKELVTGDEGRTIPSVSQILNNKAKPLKLDVLNIAIDDRGLMKK